MRGVVLSKIYSPPPISQKEILRYAGCKDADENILKLINQYINEAKDKISYKVCYCELDVKAEDNVCDFGVCKVTSKDLATNLKGCTKVILFAATLGANFDRLIAKYSRLSPAKALMLEALGNERIEALCDAFCEDIKAAYKAPIKPRFSAGYGDLPIDIQRSIFALLDCERSIGLTLNGSLLMSPSKSVTAFVGIAD